MGDDEFVPGFVIGVIAAMLVCVCIHGNFNFSYKEMTQRLERGVEFCKDHQGVESLDHGGEFFCKDGTSIKGKD